MVLAFACSVVATRSARADILQETWEETYPVSATVTLHVRNGDGRIYIYGSEENEMKVTAVKRAFTKARLDVIAIRVAVTGDTATGGDIATIETIIPPLSPGGGLTQDRSGTVEYTIIVPQNCSVAQSDLAKGEILIEGMRGASVNATLGRGRLLARNCFSPTKLSVSEGGMDIFFAWWEEQPFSLQGEISDGDLRVGLPEEASLRLEAGSSRGRVLNLFAEEGAENGEAQELRTTFGSGGPGEMTLRAGTGNIRIEKAF